jgi:hypothetical protein
VLESLYLTKNLRRIVELDADDHRLDLISCTAGHGYLGHTEQDLIMPAFADIAFDVIFWREGLKRAGYPAALWRSALSDYEQRAVDRAIAVSKSGGDPDDYEIPESFFKGLERDVAPYHAAHPATWHVVNDGGCGAVEAKVSIATRPTGGQVFVIPTFFYQLCKVQKQNADDTHSCPNWREAVDGQVSEVAGDYQYQVRWHDGSVRRGRLSFDYNDDGHTITLRKP